jgi:hypothetical protein
MKRHLDGWMILAVLSLAVGCSKTTAPENSQTAGPTGNAAAASNSDTPGATLAKFLEALRTNNSAQAAALLTPVARQKAAAQNRNILPPPSDTAKFSIGHVNYIGPDGAQVVTKWTDLDDNGQWQSDDAVWVLRKEPEGWRVAGVAWMPFPNEPPVKFNFEDPDEIDRTREWLGKEMQRRQEDGNLQAREPETKGNALRR